MAKFTEEALDSWRKPASQNEEQKISNAISMIKDALSKNPVLSAKNIEPVVQGSYANNTNVKLDSDVDVSLMLKDTFYTEYPDGGKDSDYGFSEGTNDFSEYRRDVISAIETKFGKDNVKVGNKSIKINSNSYHVQADVVPCFQYRNYKWNSSENPDRFEEGIKFYSSDNQEVVNYPKIHVSNGITKNSNTQRRYKRTVRLYKSIRNKMIADGINVSKDITSFLLECMLWNVPNKIFNDNNTWNDILRETIRFLFFETKAEEKCKNWGEVSEHFYLFHSDRKWTRSSANAFLVQMWNFLGYADE